MSASNPIRNRLRDQRLEISKLIEMIGNGEQANAATAIAAIKVVVDAIKIEVDAASSASITTI